MAAFDRCEELMGNPDTANFGRAQALAAQQQYKKAVALLLKGGEPKRLFTFTGLVPFIRAVVTRNRH